MAMIVMMIGGGGGDFMNRDDRGGLDRSRRGFIIIIHQ